MRRIEFSSSLASLWRTAAVCAAVSVLSAGLAGEKIIYDESVKKSDLPDADARKGLGFEKFDQLDKKSSVSGVVGVPEIPFTLMPRSKKQIEQLERQRNFLLNKPEEAGSQFLTPESALGVREEDWVSDPAQQRPRSSFERFIAGEDVPAGKKNEGGALLEAVGGGGQLGFDLGRSQVGSFGQLSFNREKKPVGPQVEQPDLFGGTMTASPFSITKTAKEREKSQKSRDDFARLLDPHAETTQKEMRGLNPLMTAPGEASSIEPVAAFALDLVRKEIGSAKPLSPNSRGVDDLVQRKEELLSPFQQAIKGRSSVSFGTIDPGGSRFLNFGSGGNFVPSVQPQSISPRPGVLEFPSRKF